MAEARPPKDPPARPRPRPRPSAEPQDSIGEPAKRGHETAEHSGEGALPRQREGDYEVGYGRPPLDSRIKPGEKRNPKGRPRGSKNTATLVTEELDKKISAREGNRVTTLSKRQAAVRNLATKAAAGDPKALMTLAALEGGSGTPHGNPDEELPLAEKNRAILQHMRQEMAASLRINAQQVEKERI